MLSQIVACQKMRGGSPTVWRGLPHWFTPGRTSSQILPKCSRTLHREAGGTDKAVRCVEAGFILFVEIIAGRFPHTVSHNLNRHWSAPTKYDISGNTLRAWPGCLFKQIGPQLLYGLPVFCTERRGVGQVQTEILPCGEREREADQQHWRGRKGNSV